MTSTSASGRARLPCTLTMTLMDQWALYTAGKISKPTQSSQLLRLDPRCDFVIEFKDHPPREGSELTDLYGQCLAVDPVSIDNTSFSNCDELYRPGLISRSSQVVNRRREKLWHETCQPGRPPLVTLQAAVGAFALGVIASVTSLVLFWR